MAYVKNTWVDQKVERPKTYEMTNNPDGSVTLVDSFGNVEELGTPVNADNMNHIEDGIEACSFTKYDKNTIYNKNDLVTVIQDEKPVIYCSLTDENLGNDLTSEYWAQISLGGGGGLEIGDIGLAPLGIDETQNKRRYINGQLILQDQFVSFTNKVKKTVELYPSLACTEEQWQATVTMTAFGQCGKFVIDDEAGTIRLPKITGFIQGLTDLASLGELVGAGSPNIVGQVTNVFGGGTTGLSGWGALKPSLNTTHGAFNSGTQYNSGSTITLDASLSNAIYGKSNTVQPESIRYPYFIQVATGAEESVDVTREIELNNPYSLGDSKYSPVALDNISWLKSEGQWNSKAVYPDYYDWILTNANNGVADFKLSTDTYDDYSWVVNTADETFRLPLLNGEEDISGGTEYRLSNVESEVPFTCDKNGCYIAGTSSGTTGVGVSVTADNNTSGELQKCVASQTNQQVYASIKACRGDSVQFYLGGVNSFVSFAPYKGNGSLYFYVGETVQNANLINAGRIEETLVNKVDKNSSWGFPSNRIVALSAGASGSSYTAPADGWFAILGTSTANVAYIDMITDSGLKSSSWISASNNYIRNSIEVAKGDVMTYYSYNASNVEVKFIYAQGEA